MWEEALDGLASTSAPTTARSSTTNFDFDGEPISSPTSPGVPTRGKRFRSLPRFRIPTKPTTRPSATRSSALLTYMDLDGGHTDHRGADRSGVPRILHQRPDRRPAGRGRRSSKGDKIARRCLGDGRAGFGSGEASGRIRRPRSHLQGSRLRVARRRLLDVPRDEPRHPPPRRTLRLHLEPQLRRTPGAGWSHPSGLTRDGGGGGDRRPLRRRRGNGQ